jgi:predicted Zn-dependent peptidase
MGGSVADELPGFGTITRTGPARDMGALLDDGIAAARRDVAETESPSDDPATRLEQLLAAQTTSRLAGAPIPLAVIVSGKVDLAKAFATLEVKLGQTAPGKIEPATPMISSSPNRIQERITKPLSQGGLGYVVEVPAPDSREAMVLRMLLYVLTHDYSGRLGNSAIRDKGIVYHIYSQVRTDGRRSWATISTGVDPDKADAMEGELRAQLARLVIDPPTAAETDAARAHLLGRDLTAAQSNEELAAKLAREFVETGGPRSHDQLRALIETITPADLANAARAFARGTVVRVDVGAATP